jgi:hypothetical protein
VSISNFAKITPQIGDPKSGTPPQKKKIPPQILVRA